MRRQKILLLVKNKRNLVGLVKYENCSDNSISGIAKMFATRQSTRIVGKSSGKYVRILPSDIIFFSMLFEIAVIACGS